MYQKCVIPKLDIDFKIDYLYKSNIGNNATQSIKNIKRWKIQE